MNEYMYWILMFLSVFVASFSQILLKKGAQNKYESVIKEYLNPYVISGYTLMMLTTVLTVLAYKGLDYKNGPVIESLGYVLIMVLSYLFFREKITLKKVLGNGLVILGIIIFYI